MCKLTDIRADELMRIFSELSSDIQCVIPYNDGFRAIYEHSWQVHGEMESDSVDEDSRDWYCDYTADEADNIIGKDTVLRVHIMREDLNSFVQTMVDGGYDVSYLNYATQSQLMMVLEECSILAQDDEWMNDRTISVHERYNAVEHIITTILRYLRNK